MKRLTPFIAGVLLLSACASSPVVSGDFNEDLSAEDQSATTAATAESDSGQAVSIEDSGQSLTPADDPLERPEGSEDVEEELVVAEDKPEPPSVDPNPPAPLEPVVTGEVPADLLEAITEDLMARTSASESVATIRSESVIWNDGSLGCPEPGVMYTQAPVDGYWVILSIDSAEFDYRATARGSFRLCEGTTRQNPTG